MFHRLVALTVLALALGACVGPLSNGLDLVAYGPEDGATAVPVDAHVFATFNANLNESTLDGAVTLTATGGQEVTGTLAYDPTSRTATFTPATDLAAATEYTASIAGTVTSSSGGSLAGGATWSFTTAAGTDPQVELEIVGGNRQLDPGQTAQLELEIDGAPIGSGGTWSSSDESVATVDQDGLVTAVGPGIAIITVTLDGVSVSITVTVNGVAGVAITSTQTGVAAGATLQLQVSVAAYGTASPAVSWSSGDEGVATVAAAGLVTGVASGTATITVTSVQDASKGDSVLIAVDPVVSGVSIAEGDQTLRAGATTQLSATVEVVGGAGAVTWSSDDESVATVDADGLVTAVSFGSASVTATSTDDTSASDAVTVTVYGDVQSLEIDEGDQSVDAGATVQLNASVSVSGGPDTVIWSSDDETVATVDANGLVTGVGAGTATITATSVADPDVSVSVTVTVSAVVDELAITGGGDQTLAPGDTHQYGVDVQVTGGTSAVTWSSSDTDVATVDASGLVTAVGPGVATITVTSDADPSVTDTVTITVSGVAGVAVSATTASVSVGGTLNVTVTVTAYGGVSTGVSWSSDDEAVATVDASGVVTGVAPGTATITATSDHDASRSDGLLVTVSAPAFEVGATTSQQVDGTTLTIARPGGTAVGDLLVAQIVFRGGSGVTPSVPSGWTLAHTTNNGSSLGQRIYFKVVTASEPANYAWGWSGGREAGGAITVYRNVNAAHAGGPVITASSNSGDSNAPTTASVAGTTNALLVTFYAVMADVTFTSTPSGMTGTYALRFNSAADLGLASHRQVLASAAATGVRTTSTSSGDKWVATAILLRPN